MLIHIYIFTFKYIILYKYQIYINLYIKIDILLFYQDFYQNFIKTSKILFIMHKYIILFLPRPDEAPVIKIFLFLRSYLL
jgi:hypothetical protein